MRNTGTRSVDGDELNNVPVGYDFTLSESNCASERDESLCHDAGLGRVVKDFTPIDNDGSDWDEVEDWDALLP